MQDTFWTDENVSDFIRDVFASCSDEFVASKMQQFKSSKTKKEWEIVAFRHARGSMLVYKLRQDGRYRSDDVPFSDGFTMEQMVEDEEIIHSVRRLSDGEVFSVGDKIQTCHGVRTITAIRDASDYITIEHCHGSLTSRKPDGIFYEIQKLPQPILTTVDQKEVKEGDLVFYVNSDNFISDIWMTKDSFGDDKNPCNVFSTREAAEEYILNNRPLLSLSDVKYVLDSIQFAHDNTRPFILEVLTNAVKQKLNQ